MLLPSDDMVKNRVFAIHPVARTVSTQDVVRRAARAGAADGFCCMAGEQTAGRGRLGRPWLAPPGTALLASVLLHVPTAAAPAVPFAAGLAMADALQALCGVGVHLKWPNDVLVERRKLAGLLVEVCGDGAPPGVAALIVGAGVNLTVEHLPDEFHALSLHRVVETPPAPLQLLEAWLARLDAWAATLEEEGLRPVIVEWRRRSTGLDEEVRVATPAGVVRGVAAGVRDDGALLVRTAGGVVPVLAGDVELLGEDRDAVPMHDRP
jgi:BirA family biotin operon repressor/biotin-[acetyl-CoA-carboxylase] ligase